MALKVRIGPIRHTLEFGYKGDDNRCYAKISDHEVGFNYRETFMKGIDYSYYYEQD